MNENSNTLINGICELNGIVQVTIDIRSDSSGPLLSVDLGEETEYTDILIKQVNLLHVMYLNM